MDQTMPITARQAHLVYPDPAPSCGLSNAKIIRSCVSQKTGFSSKVSLIQPINRSSVDQLIFLPLRKLHSPYMTLQTYIPRNSRQNNALSIISIPLHIHAYTTNPFHNYHHHHQPPSPLLTPTTNKYIPVNQPPSIPSTALDLIIYNSASTGTHRQNRTHPSLYLSLIIIIHLSNSSIY